MCYHHYHDYDQASIVRFVGPQLINLPFAVFMRFKTKIAFLLILFYGLQFNSNGQTITLDIMKKMIVSREYKDSIVNSFNFIKGARIPAAIFGIGFESYMSPDSSKMIYLSYRDSGIGCSFYTKDLNLLQHIISTGQIDGFAKTTTVNPNPNATAYIKGNYLLLFVNFSRERRKSAVSLIKNYQVFNNWLKPN
jgi:hypothetical protein